MTVQSATSASQSTPIQNSEEWNISKPINDPSVNDMNMESESIR